MGAGGSVGDGVGAGGSGVGEGAGSSGVGVRGTGVGVRVGVGMEVETTDVISAVGVGTARQAARRMRTSSNAKRGERFTQMIPVLLTPGVSVEPTLFSAPFIG